WDYGKRMSNREDEAHCEQAARENAQLFATCNAVGNVGPELDENTSNSVNGDMVFGYIEDFAEPTMTNGTATPSNPYNAVKVLVRRDESLNGEAPMFFGRVFGLTGTDLQAEATAALVRDVKGFSTPSSGQNIDLLPFALDLQTWTSWTGGSGPDAWTWDAEDKCVLSGSDGWLEVNLYPQGTGSPGNRGTVDIGSSNNSTADIVRQILYGVNAEDLAYHGGALVFDQCGKLYLNGDTGISAGVKDDLAAIKGQPRIIPIFSSVNGPGNNAVYTIVKWMGIRIMDVKLTGPMSQKRVTIQAAPVVGPGIVPATTSGSSSYVYSPAVLVK
ncbi:MAG: TadG family pilus assembly protein, partial [Bythopirellula sp.]|nr:TadG family pilus assembly protein [Bythopirellula sp.]